MNEELATAVRRVQERKAAAGIPWAGSGDPVYLADTSGLLVGTGLVTEEVNDVARAIAAVLIGQVGQVGPFSALGGAWVDGLLTGLALADLRREQEDAPDVAEALARFRFRRPYVGTGANGARRSATIDREEADTLPANHPRINGLWASARNWDRQAQILTLVEAGI